MREMTEQGQQAGWSTAGPSYLRPAGHGGGR